MSEIISKDLVQDRIDRYITENRNEIVEMIDKKKDTKVKESIIDIFIYQNNWGKTTASQMIQDKVEAEIALRAENTEIDREWIQEQVEKKARTVVRNIDVVMKK